MVPWMKTGHDILAFSFWYSEMIFVKQYIILCFWTIFYCCPINLHAEIKSIKEPVLGIEFVAIPAGTFIMGGQDNDAINVQHKVTLTSDFWLSKYEITLGQWQKIMDKKELHQEKANPFANDDPQYPIVSISYNDIQVFLQKLNQLSTKYNFRLPTEAEWEYACRAGTITRFYFGDAIIDSQANYNAEIASVFSMPGKNIGHPVKVGSYSPNSWGLYDMHGNVWEWVSDWYAPFSSDSVVDPKGPENGSEKVIRGGSFYFGADNATSSHRRTHDPATWGFSIGFRLVAEPRKQ